MLDAIQEIIRGVLDDDDIVISAQTTARDVDGWDSLAHVMIMTRVEQHFGIRFRVSDVAELRNVGELVALVEKAKG
jgi:acyl carrier protein